MDKDAFRQMNADLCSFGMRWAYDGDYLRCTKCKRAQLTTYADHEFPHAAGCKAIGKVEATPWRSLMEIVRPLYEHVNRAA